MVRAQGLAALFVLVMGCGTKVEDSAAGGAGPQPGEGEGEGEGEVNLPDPRESAVYDPACDDFDGVAIPAATSFFYGQYAATSEPDVWAGQEQWILFANDTWREYGEDDCVITWSTTAVRSDGAGTCGQCQYGLTVSATLDLANTSCPEGLYEGAESFEAVYGVEVNGEAATWYFAASGTLLGTGYAADGAANFLSEAACTYF